MVAGEELETANTELRHNGVPDLVLYGQGRTRCYLLRLLPELVLGSKETAQSAGEAYKFHWSSGAAGTSPASGVTFPFSAAAMDNTVGFLEGDDIKTSWGCGRGILRGKCDLLFSREHDPEHRMR